MVRPPDAEPVRAARILVAAKSETSGPPSMPSTHAFAPSKAGSDATAPKPTRFATLMIRYTRDPARARRLRTWETIARRRRVLYDLGGYKKDDYGTTNTSTLPLTRTSDV